MLLLAGAFALGVATVSFFDEKKQAEAAGAIEGVYVWFKLYCYFLIL